MLQVQYWMFPASVHVASFASVLVRLCPSAATTVSSWLISVSPFSSLKIFPHSLQVQYSMFPASVQVAASASVLVRVWPFAATTVSFSSISVVPSASLNSFLQVPQVQYAMFPASVQVAAFASVLVSVMALRGYYCILFCDLCCSFCIAEQFFAGLQVQYSMFAGLGAGRAFRFRLLRVMALRGYYCIFFCDLCCSFCIAEQFFAVPAGPVLNGPSQPLLYLLL